jgi:hypothetical protein
MTLTVAFASGRVAGAAVGGGGGGGAVSAVGDSGSGAQPAASIAAATNAIVIRMASTSEWMLES